MLHLEAEIYLDKLSENSNALQNDLDTTNIIRPSINFGNDLLFSGTIKANKEIGKIVRGKFYIVTIELPTVEHQEYEYIKDLIKINSIFKLQIASRIIGSGKVKKYKII